ncbi:MAG: M56 family metallopeptidase [Mucilaginibacter sp.]
MIDYIIRSTICLVILLAAYHLFLEKEKMHRFNRYFLLLSLVVGMAIPLLTLNISVGPISPIKTHVIDEPVITVNYSSAVVLPDKPPVAEKTFNIMFLVLAIYGAGVILLTGRFIHNLYKIFTTTFNYDKVKVNEATIVLVTEKILPHTFLRYIFFNEDEYINKTIDNKLFTHELTHAKQKHSVDILLIELLHIMLWFNPIFIFYKKAIRLNHEFLADEAVVQSFDDVASYQQLLLEKTLFTQPINLSSNLTYSLTKKRMIMMSKNTPKSRAMMKKIALVPLFAALIFLFSNNVRALSIMKGSIPHLNRADTAHNNTPKDLYYKDATVKYKNKQGIYVIKKYEDMTQAEKTSMPVPFPPPAKNAPTEALLNEWKGSAKYGVWVDGKHIANKDLDNYKASDFTHYWKSRLMKNALNYGVRRFQIDLFSPAYFDDNYIKPRNLPGKKIMVFETSKGGRFAIPVAKFSDPKLKAEGVVFAK